MRYQLPKTQHDYQTRLNLWEAFQRVGHFLFPEDWTGREGYAAPKSPSASLQEEKQLLENNVRRLRDQEFDLKTFSTQQFTESQYIQHQAAKDLAAEAARDAQIELERFGETFDSRYRDAAAYERRKSAEEHLCDAISRGVLRLITETNMIVDFGHVRAQKSARLSLRYSFIRFPDGESRYKRQLVFIDRNDFQAWAAPQEEVLFKYCIDSIEEQAVRWFLGYQQKQLAVGEHRNQDEAFQECNELFEGQVSKATFAAIWKIYVKQGLRRKGRAKSIKGGT